MDAVAASIIGGKVKKVTQAIQLSRLGTAALPPESLLPRSWDAVLLDDDMSGPLSHWEQGDNAAGQLGDSVHAMPGHAKSGKLSTAPVPASHVGGKGTAYCRFYDTHEDGYLVWLAWLAYRGASEVGSPGTIGMFIDHQKWDDSARSFAKVALRRRVDDGGGEAWNPRWSVVKDEPHEPSAQRWVDIPGAVPAVWPPDNKSAIPGWNVNHANFWSVAVVMSLNDEDNNGLYDQVGWGRYHRLIVGPHAFDLTTVLANDDGTAPGSGGQWPGTTTGGENPQSSFSGGLNFGISLSNSESSNYNYSQLYIGHALGLHYPRGTEFPVVS